MSGDLWICRACDLASLAIELRPQRILSIAEPGFRNPTPDGIAPDDHHHLNFDDITEAMNRVCDEVETKPDAFTAAAARRVLDRSEW